MESTLKTSAWGMIGAVAVFMAGPPASALASSAMPVAQQNTLVQTYCAVCHNDAHLNGGLSLEHFDAAQPDPGLAAMLVSKLKGKAMGAAGIPLPDRATQDALLSALSSEAAGASGWNVIRTPILTASVVQGALSAANGGEPDLYRLTLTCNADTHEGEMQLAWSPGVPSPDRVMSFAVDEKAPLTYKVESGEKMFKGASGDSGTGAIILYPAIPLPAQTLTISNLFSDETVVFPFGGLTQPVRKALSTCFTGGSNSQ
jgi:hypothetical protein